MNEQTQSVSAFSNQFLGNLEQFVYSKIQEELQKQKEILETEFQEKLKKEQEKNKAWEWKYDKLDDEYITEYTYSERLFKCLEKVIEKGKEIAIKLDQANEYINLFNKNDILTEDFIKYFFKKKKPLTINTFYSILRQEKLIKVQTNLKNTPTQKALDLNLLVYKKSISLNYRLHITSQGQEYFTKLLEKYFYYKDEVEFMYDQAEKGKDSFNLIDFENSIDIPIKVRTSLNQRLKEYRKQKELEKTKKDT